MLLKSQGLKSLKYLNCPVYNKMGRNRLLKCIIKMEELLVKSNITRLLLAGF